MASDDIHDHDQEAADTLSLELVVLDRLLYRSRSQHRGAKYFNLMVKVRQTCCTFAPSKVPGLLAQGLSLLSRVPDSRSGRAREFWVRSAATALARLRMAAVACSEALRASIQASQLLAHQVSQTYFMALSIVLLALLARLFACNLYLGGRLLELHGALIRAVKAQPSASACLPPNTLAACDIPEDITTFLSRLRDAGSSKGSLLPKNSREGVTATQLGSGSSCSTASLPNPGDRVSDAQATGRNKSNSAAAHINSNIDDRDNGDDDADDGDEGVRIGRASALDGEPAADALMSRNASLSTARALVTAGVGRRTDSSSYTCGIEGRRVGMGADKGGAAYSDPSPRSAILRPPPKKTVLLASEFSESDTSSDEEYKIAGGNRYGKNKRSTTTNGKTDADAVTRTRRTSSGSKRPRPASSNSEHAQPAAPPPANQRETTATAASLSFAGASSVPLSTRSTATPLPRPAHFFSTAERSSIPRSVLTQPSPTHPSQERPGEKARVAPALESSIEAVPTACFVPAALSMFLDRAGEVASDDPAAKSKVSPVSPSVLTTCSPNFGSVGLAVDPATRLLSSGKSSSSGGARGWGEVSTLDNTLRARVRGESGAEDGRKDAAVVTGGIFEHPNGEGKTGGRTDRSGAGSRTGTRSGKWKSRYSRGKKHSEASGVKPPKPLNGVTLFKLDAAGNEEKLNKKFSKGIPEEQGTNELKYKKTNRETSSMSGDRGGGDEGRSAIDDVFGSLC